MKIGILTHPLDYNYGCLLQAYALQLTLKRMGHEVVTINRYNHIGDNFFYNLRSICFRLIRKIHGNRNINLAWNPFLTIKEKEILTSKTKLFVDRNIINTGIIFPENLKEIDEKYQFDAYIVGSDQVWLPHFALNSFLDFVKRDNVKMLFYAASTGNSCFTDNEILTNKCKDLCKRFSDISVRESYLIEKCQKYLSRNAVQVLDPTLLLTPKDYLSVCIEKTDNNPIVFSYLLDENDEKKQLVDKVRKELDLPVISGMPIKKYTKDKKSNIDECIYPSVDNWLLSLSRAKFVVTDSFHGTAMSILFGKPFVTFCNISRGADRFKSILEMFKLENRIIYSLSDFNESYYEELNMDFLSVILQQQRDLSISFINSNL